MKILVVEYDGAIARILSAGLTSALKHPVDVARDGVEGLLMALSQNYALVILDWMLPGISGVEVCAELHARRIGLPIVILKRYAGARIRAPVCSG